MAKAGHQPEVVLYSQAFCGYCSAARKLLESKGIAFTLIDVTLDAAGRQEARERSGRSTLPQIFIDDRPVGGYDDIATLEREGKLDSLLGLPAERAANAGEPGRE